MQQHLEIFPQKKLTELNRLGFNNFGDNDINPLLILLEEKRNNLKAINLLIPLLNRETINHYTEIGMTPLHLACLFNMDSVVGNLLKYGADLNLKERKYENTPMHIVCENGNYESLQIILGQNNISPSALKRPDGKTPFDLAIQESFICTKMFINRNKSEFNDYNIENALYSGRIDIYNYLSSIYGISPKLIEEIKNNLFESYEKEENFYKETSDRGRINNQIYLNGVVDKYLEKIIENGDLFSIKRLSKFVYNNNITCSIDSSSIFKSRNIDILEILTSRLNFFINKYEFNLFFLVRSGMLYWIKHFKKYDFIDCKYEELDKVYEKGEINNPSISEESIKNSKTTIKQLDLDIMIIFAKENYLLLFELLDEIDYIFPEILDKILYYVLKSDDLIIIEQFYNYLLKDKFKKNKISINFLIRFNSSPKQFLIALECPLLDLSTLSLKDIVNYCSTDVISILVNHPKIKKECPHL